MIFQLFVFYFQAVINRILLHWDSLTLFFERAVERDNLPIAKSIVNALNNVIYRIYFYFLSYMLELVTKINLEFQSEKPQLPMLLPRVSSLYKMILKSFVQKDIFKKEEFTKISIENPRKYMPLDEMYFGAKIDELFKKKTPRLTHRNFTVLKLEHWGFI